MAPVKARFKVVALLVDVVVLHSSTYGDADGVDDRRYEILMLAPMMFTGMAFLTVVEFGDGANEQSRWESRTKTS